MRRFRTPAFLLCVVVLAAALAGCSPAAGGDAATGNGATDQGLDTDALLQTLQQSDLGMKVEAVELESESEPAVLVLTVRTPTYGSRGFVPALAAFTGDVEPMLTQEGVDSGAIRLIVLGETGDRPETVIQVKREDVQAFAKEELALDEYFLRWEFPS